MYAPLFFELHCLLVCAALFVFFENVLALRVHEMKIEIINAAALKLQLKQRAYLLFAVEERCGKLVRENKAFSGVAAHYAVAYGAFAFCAEIYSRRVEIVEAGLHEIIYHAAEFAAVDFVALHRQTHAA